MIPVLLHVSRACESQWVPIKSASQVRVHGLNGKSVVEILFNNGEEPLTIVKDGVYPLPSLAQAVKALVKKIEGTVSVDLVK